MAKKYRVTLTDAERQALHELTQRRSETSWPVRRVYILLAVDEGGEKHWTDQQICESYGMSVRMVERTRQRFVDSFGL
jgi:hypothetical protein